MFKKKNPLIIKGFFSLLAVGTGLEPATPCVTGTYSNQLNYPTVAVKRCKSNLNFQLHKLFHVIFFFFPFAPYALYSNRRRHSLLRNIRLASKKTQGCALLLFFSFLCSRVETLTHNPAFNAAEYPVSSYRLFNRILETARFRFKTKRLGIRYGVGSVFQKWIHATFRCH